MFTADAHSDTLYALAVEGKQPDQCDITADKLVKGDVRLQTFAMFAGPNGIEGEPYKKCRAALDYSYHLGIPIYRGALPDAIPDTVHGVVTIEGGEALEGSLERLHEFAAEGVRMIALTWNHTNEIAHPAAEGPEHGLTAFGKRLITEMNDLNVLCDVSHLNEAGFWDVIDHTIWPPVASHSNLRELCLHKRNLWRDQARAIFDHQGFIGVNFYPNFINDSGTATIDDLVHHIDELVQMGGIDSVGFGSDFDGIGSWPDGLYGPQDIPQILSHLSALGYDTEALSKIAGLNLWRVYSLTLGE